MREALVNRFTNEGFFRVYEAPDGEIGLKMALEKLPDIIVLDLLMPKMNGLEMLKKLRGDAWGKKAPVIILTALEEDDEINKVISKHEPSFYLVKTNVTPSDVVAKVAEVIGA